MVFVVAGEACRAAEECVGTYDVLPCGRAGANLGTAGGNGPPRGSGSLQGPDEIDDVWGEDEHADYG